MLTARRHRPSAERGWRSPATGQSCRRPGCRLSLICNPSIADVAVKSGNLWVVVGKSFGITNISALYTRTQRIHDQSVLVKRNEGKVVNLVHGPQRRCCATPVRSLHHHRCRADSDRDDRQRSADLGGRRRTSAIRMADEAARAGCTEALQHGRLQIGPWGFCVSSSVVTAAFNAAPPAGVGNFANGRSSCKPRPPSAPSLHLTR